MRFMRSAEKSLFDIRLLLEKSLILDYVNRKDVERISDYSREIGIMLKTVTCNRLVAKNA